MLVNLEKLTLVPSDVFSSGFSMTSTSLSESERCKSKSSCNKQTNKQVFDNEFVVVHLINTNLRFFIYQLTVAKNILSVGQSSLFFDGMRLTITVTSFFKGRCGRTLKF